MTRVSRLLERLSQLGIEVDAQLFELAVTHRSYAYEHPGVHHNERLEFLGDAVLEIVVTEHIFRTYPELPEGHLAKLRASVVSSVALAKVAQSLDIGSHIRLGKGEIATQGEQKTSILADTTEAIIGAIHMSAGADASARFVHATFDELITASEAAGDYADYKTVLQEICAAKGWSLPRYDVVGEGPDHLRTFTAVVVIDDQPRGSGVASSKKRAEQIAARIAVKDLNVA